MPRTFLELVKAIKINFAQGIIEPDSGSGTSYDFEISPKEFLSFSKHDFKAGDKRGNINALTNAKRAVDCQTDKVLFSLGIDSNSFPAAVGSFISKSSNSPSKKDLPVRLKFLQAMAFAPAEIIANARTLRNKLEHYYEAPSSEEVSSAIELAELFILATDSKLKSIWNFTISDEEKQSKHQGLLYDAIYVAYQSQPSTFEVTAYIGENDRERLIVDVTQPLFYYLLKIATSLDYEQDASDAVVDLMDFIEHPMPKNHMNISLI